jgi:ATP-dependent Lon protease
MDADKLVLAASQRDMSIEEPGTADLHRVGTLSECLQALPLPDGSVRGVLRGLDRARVLRVLRSRNCFWAEVEIIKDQPLASIETEALARECVDTFVKLAGYSKEIPSEAAEAVMHAESSRVADTIVHHLPIKAALKQEILSTFDPGARLQAVLDLVTREEHLLRVRHHIRMQADSQIQDSQREFILREQLKAIRLELYGSSELLDEADRLASQIEAADLPPIARQHALEDLRRYERATPDTPEAGSVRSHLEWLLALPWNSLSAERLDLQAAEAALNEQNFGLEAVKERILEYLAVRRLGGGLRGPILLFEGPPGVGKTSLARSIAFALGRELVSMSLGGLRDEAEIRGHRRTYVGAMPGKIIQRLRQCGTRNPVFLLDEIDKLSSDTYRGDPAGALLEALDPEQNHGFADHYIEAPFDLSAVLFVATANSAETIPAALRDRMELIQFPSYTRNERKAIASGFILPQGLREAGLDKEQLVLTDAALDLLVSDYSREAGVRGAAKQIATLCRRAARQIGTGASRKVTIDVMALKDILGPPEYQRTLPMRDEVGTATALAVSGIGGETLTVEVALLQPLGATPDIRVTGSLGEVMRESAETAVSLVRSLEPRNMLQDIHIHVPQGDISKDGPSAGAAIVVALVSALTGRAVKHDRALTGEITLRGNILRVGGVREKILAAEREGFSCVILPEGNVPDLADVPQSVLDRLTIVPVATARQAIEAALVASPHASPTSILTP